MAQRGALVALGGGRYAIATLGETSAARLPRLNLLDADLASLGPYYRGFWSALNDHRLTDVEAPAMTVAIGFDSGRVQRMGHGGRHADRLGPTAYRRVGALLRLAGHPELAAERLPPRNSNRARVLSLSGDVDAIDGAEIDSMYRVALTPDRAVGEVAGAARRAASRRPAA